MGFIDELYKGLGENDCNQDVPFWLSTGFIPLNIALGGDKDKGFPGGRITEISGMESTGKTLLATMAMIGVQRLGGLAVFLDYEHSFSIYRAIQLGLSEARDQWIYKQPNTAEEGFRIVDFVCDHVAKHNINKPVIIVKDSVASMVTQEELEAGYEGNMKTRLSLATFMSTALKQVAGKISKSNVTLLLLNQVRINPTIMYGDKKTTPGGNAIKFYSSVRLQLSKAGQVKEGDEVIGENINAVVKKNKVYRPFTAAAYVTDFDMGVNLELSHINALEKAGLLTGAKGYVDFEGKSWRKKALAEFFRNEDQPAYSRLLGMFSGATPEEAVRTPVSGEGDPGDASIPDDGSGHEEAPRKRGRPRTKAA